MRVDWEAVLQDLKIHLESKDSHGRRELHTKIGELEAKHSLKEGVLERALRTTGNRLSEDLIRDGHDPSEPAAAGAGLNGSADQPLAETQ